MKKVLAKIGLWVAKKVKGYDWIMQQLIKFLAKQVAKEKGVKEAAAEYVKGQPFLEIVRIYSLYNSVSGDEKIIDAIMTKGLKYVLRKELELGKIMLPDLTPENAADNWSVVDVFDELMKEVAK